MNNTNAKPHLVHERAVILRKAWEYNACPVIKLVIPPRKASDGRSQLDREVYFNCNVVERCFGRLKEYRRIATRFDKTTRNYLAMVKLGCIRILYQWLLK